jgi:hypothetical protein
MTGPRLDDPLKYALGTMRAFPESPAIRIDGETLVESPESIFFVNASTGIRMRYRAAAFSKSIDKSNA